MSNNAPTTGLFPWLVEFLALLLGAFHLLNVSGLLVLSTMEIRAFHLMIILCIVFLANPIRNSPGAGPDKNALLLILTVLALASGGYMLMQWQTIAMSGGVVSSLDLIAGAIVLLLVLEATRRRVGGILAIIAVIFLAYPFVCPYLPGILYSRGYGLERVVSFLGTSSEGVYGIPIGVASTYIILFTIYGAFLAEFGAGDFFFKLANATTGNLRAASAKSAVIFSTLFGMVSGSAAGNVAVTGAFTIPMMKREGYRAEQAGAIEAVVSTGGQIMPPVMGAAAFIMAEIIGTPYVNVMKAGLVPALLFFASILFVVHLQAVKNNIEPRTGEQEEEHETVAIILLRGMPFIIPFAALIAMMLSGYSPFKASFYSILALLLCDLVWHRRLNAAWFLKSVEAVKKGVKNAVPISIACAAAGIISGILSMTGLGSKLSSLIILASAGLPLFALLLTMVTAIILGMGLPTTAAYLILASVVAPALSEMGVPLLTAHMFVFYYGCVSTITPPVALAAYVAAGIAEADINKVGWTAFRYRLTSYILPFMFFLGPALLLAGNAIEISLAVVTGLVGVFAVSCAIVGQFRSGLSLVMRGIFLTAGMLLLAQGITTDLAGAAMLLAAIVTVNRHGPKSTKLLANADN